MTIHRNDAETAKIIERASARKEMLSPGSKSKRVKCSSFALSTAGIIDAVSTKSVAAETKETVSRTFGRLPKAITKPAPTNGASTASTNLMS